MNDTLSTVLTVGPLVLAAVAAVYMVLDRVTDRLLLGLLALLEIGLLVQLVVGVVALVGGDRDVNAFTFVGYLVGLLLIPPAAAWWGRNEPSRWGTGVILVAALVVPVLVERLQQIWDAGSAA